MTDKIGDIDIDELVASGVYDPRWKDADELLSVIRTVVERGATLDELVEYKGDLGQLFVRLLVRPGAERLSLEEMADRAGLSVERALQLHRVAGFADVDPTKQLFDENDIEVLIGIEFGCKAFGDEIMLQLARVMGWAMARVADAMMSTFATDLGVRSQTITIDEPEMSELNRAAAGMLPGAVRIMDVLLRRHVHARYRPGIVLGEAWQGVDALDRAIGFCDLVGYTALTEQLETRELTKLVASFEQRAADVVIQGGGSVVKLIGDEVMYVAADARVASRIAVALVEAFAGQDLPPVRIGVAAGRVVLREGDYYGPVVNLAARLVKLAPPGIVLAPSAFRNEVDDTVTFEDAGSPSLKGFEASVELVALRRA